jgi:hypothetical protein
MTVRREIAQSPRETGVWSREGGSPPAWTPGHRVQVRHHRACEVERPLHDRGAKREYRIGF